jgi:hypothetical protein
VPDINWGLYREDHFTRPLPLHLWRGPIYSVLPIAPGRNCSTGAQLLLAWQCQMSKMHTSLTTCTVKMCYINWGLYREDHFTRPFPLHLWRGPIFSVLPIAPGRNCSTGARLLLAGSIKWVRCIHHSQHAQWKCARYKVRTREDQYTWPFPLHLVVCVVKAPDAFRVMWYIGVKIFCSNYKVMGIKILFFINFKKRNFP